MAISSVQRISLSENLSYLKIEWPALPHLLAAGGPEVCGRTGLSFEHRQPVRAGAAMLFTRVEMWNSCGQIPVRQREI